MKGPLGGSRRRPPAGQGASAPGGRGHCVHVRVACDVSFSFSVPNGLERSEGVADLGDLAPGGGRRVTVSRRLAVHAQPAVRDEGSKWRASTRAAAAASSRCRTRTPPRPRPRGAGAGHAERAPTGVASTCPRSRVMPRLPSARDDLLGARRCRTAAALALQALQQRRGGQRRIGRRRRRAAASDGARGVAAGPFRGGRCKRSTGERDQGEARACCAWRTSAEYA
jgi:hypothetical protein